MSCGSLLLAFNYSVFQHIQDQSGTVSVRHSTVSWGQNSQNCHTIKETVPVKEFNHMSPANPTLIVLRAQLPNPREVNLHFLKTGTVIWFRNTDPPFLSSSPVTRSPNQMTFTFFTSARRSFFLTGLSLASEVACCDLDPTDSLSDSERLSDSEELFDSELCDRLLTLPCSLSDWLPDSDAERLDSSEAELL